MSHKLKYVVVALISILFSLLIVEAVLRVVDNPKQAVSGWNDCKKPHECNYLGFRGRKIEYSPDDYVIVLLGDSKIAAWYLPFDSIPERRLEQYLGNYKKNVRVVTLGTHGYGQDQQLLALKEYYKKHRADLVLLFHSSTTDIEDNIFPAAGGSKSIKPTFWLDNGELAGPTEGWMEPVGPKIKLVLLWNSYFNESLGESRLKNWKRDILPTPYQPLKDYQGEANMSWHEVWKLNPREVYPSIDYERVTFADKLTPRSELRQYGIDLSRKLFTTIKELTEKNNGKFIIFKEVEPGEGTYSEDVEVYYMNGKYYRLSIRQYNDNLKDLFDGFEHYMIPLEMDNYKVSVKNNHLNQQAFDKLLQELSVVISNKEYFK